jgi:hypothetical protein
MLELSAAARERVRALFPAEDVAHAQRLLSHCTDEAWLLADLARQGVDRLVFALIRLSSGRLDRLEELAIPLLRADWRDLLVQADFAHDIHAHETWQPRRFDSDVDSRWRAGQLPAGVEFRAGDSVELLRGLQPRQTGVVTALLGLEPEPRYRVELGPGTESEHFQRALGRVA